MDGCHPELVSGSNFKHNILYNNQKSLQTPIPNKNLHKFFSIYSPLPPLGGGGGGGGGFKKKKKKIFFL